MRFQTLILLLLFFSFGLSAPKAHAFVNGFELEAGIEVPTQIGARAKFKLPGHWYATAGLGYSLNFLVGVGTALASGFGMVYSEEATLMNDALSNNFYIDLRGGYSFSENQGFFLEGGYSLLTGGGSATTIQTIDNAVRPLSAYALATDLSINAGVTLHNLQLMGGYKWSLSENWGLVLSAGLVKPLSASSTLSFSRYYIDQNRMEQDVKNLMNNLYVNQLFLISAGAWVSWKM
ncbi:MAG: hypothetical protein KDD50_09845 [Bdellovibrionales bacterium]|nr:hypothetical protein [Bdellovibrionales bacterium]